MSKQNKLISRYCQIPGSPPCDAMKKAVAAMNAKERGRAFATMKKAIAEAQRLELFPTETGHIPGIQIPRTPVAQQMRTSGPSRKILRDSK